jgi:hypothetical protein
MSILESFFGSVLKPLLVALLILVALGMMSSRPDRGGGGATFACPQYFADPQINRLVCRFHPVRLWNTPVRDLLPGVAAGAAPGEAQER